ncbi:MAG: leucyl aminopeptidase [Acidimicrobiales bacterium]|nr:leucyl aminopeptidase [Acidimicrobiales bacterium]
MPIAFSHARQVPAEIDVLGVPVAEGGRISGPSVNGQTADFLAERGFEGKLGETMAVPGAGGVTLVAVGIGHADEVDPTALRRAAAALARAAWKDARLATTLLDAAPAGVDRGAAAQAIAEGVGLAAYRFTRYKADPKAARIRSVVIVGSGGAKASTGVERGARIAGAVNAARDLINTPASDMTPRKLAAFATEVAEREGLKVTIWDEKAIAKEKLGGLASVARGSDEPPRLIRLDYDPPGAKAAVAFVGKGITFDSGGLSIKTADGMETMKTDMSGAAAVLAAMSLLPVLQPKVRVIGIVPATENMPSGRAIKPGDVFAARNGKTVEVLNTDAEGRLVLADALSLAVEAKVDAIIDLATLTGACQVALGMKIAGLMGNDDGWIAQVQDAADRAGESVWHLPLPPEYRKMIDSDVADMKNVGARWGGALTAGLFLQEFVGDVAWVHLDIAGPARSDDEDGWTVKGGTGFGVRTLIETAMKFKKP